MSSFLVIGRPGVRVKLNDEKLPTPTSPLVVDLYESMHIARPTSKATPATTAPSPAARPPPCGLKTTYDNKGLRR